MAINWGDNSALAGFQNALALGADIGGAIRQRREDSALGAYMTAQTPESQSALMKVNPKLGMQAGSYIMEQNVAKAKLAKEQQAVQLRQQAAQGDPVALQKLVGIDFDSWKALDGNKKQQIKAQTEYTGQAALRISQLPPEQQSQEWDSAIDQGVKLGYTGLADYKGKFSPDALRGAIDNAGLVEKYISLAEPKYQVIPEKGTLVDTRNPAAVSAFSGGQPAKPASKSDYDALPPGTEYMAPDGSIKRKGGGASNGTGGFR